MYIGLLLGFVLIVVLGVSQFAKTLPSMSPTDVSVAEERERISNVTAEAATTTTTEKKVASDSERVPGYDWGPLVSVRIGATLVEASVADTPGERIAGLSNTPPLPPGVVKLFVFESDGPQSIWMKDMRYPIDILWLNASGSVVHIAPGIHPDTYPATFSSPVPARYVIESRSGFVGEQGIVVGTPVTLPGRATN